MSSFRPLSTSVRWTPIGISDGDSILMAQSLAACLGLGVGISSGCNLLAAVKAQEELGGDAVVVTVFADDNKKYLSTGLLQQEPVRAGYMTPEIELTGLRVIPATRHPQSSGNPDFGVGAAEEWSEPLK